jgi:hypothetical protein
MNQGSIEHKNYNCHGKFSSEDFMGRSETMTPNGPAIWGVAVCVRVGMCFCIVPVDGQDFRVTIKLSR